MTLQWYRLFKCVTAGFALGAIAGVYIGTMAIDLDFVSPHASNFDRRTFLGRVALAGGVTGFVIGPCIGFFVSPRRLRITGYSVLGSFVSISVLALVVAYFANEFPFYWGKAAQSNATTYARLYGVPFCLVLGALVSDVISTVTDGERVRQGKRKK